jgi:hypothetical protein
VDSSRKVGPVSSRELGSTCLLSPPQIHLSPDSTDYGRHTEANPYLAMLLTPWAILALPVALRVACLDADEPALDAIFPLNTNLQAGVDQAFIEEVCPDYTNYARVKQ